MRRLEATLRDRVPSAGIRITGWPSVLAPFVICAVKPVTFGPIVPTRVARVREKERDLARDRPRRVLAVSRTAPPLIVLAIETEVTVGVALTAFLAHLM